MCHFELEIIHYITVRQLEKYYVMCTIYDGGETVCTRLKKNIKNSVNLSKFSCILGKVRGINFNAVYDRCTNIQYVGEIPG